MKTCSVRSKRRDQYQIHNPKTTITLSTMINVFNDIDLFLTRNVHRASCQRSNTIIFSRVTFSEVNCMP